MTAKGFNSDFIEELKQRNDIVTVISKYVPLEKKGRTHWGRCPFHHEKTPSFAVNQQNQFYHCFGCGVSGDVIKFIQEIESVEFLEAAEILCKQSGLQMPEINKNNTEIGLAKNKKERLLSLLKDCAKFYYTALMNENNKKAYIYLLNRGISKEYITKFGLGFSPNYESSIEYLRFKGYSNEEMLESGVAGEKNKRVYDVLGGRLIFPILNSFSEVVAFGGRIFEKSGFAKYRNTQETKSSNEPLKIYKDSSIFNRSTQETKVFNKSKNLYGINLIKKQKQQSGISNLIIVEGYMDTIALHQAGFTNAVASMGTSLTLDQARLIKRFCEDVFICYDGDAAGQKATLRGLDILKSEGLNVKVISIPNGLDPDEFISKNGAAAYGKLVEAAEPLVDFKLTNLLKENKIGITEGKRKFALESLKIASECASITEQEDILKKIRELTGFTYESLKRDLENLKSKEVLPERLITQQKEPVPEDKNIKFIIYCMLNGLGDYKDFERIEPYIPDNALKKVYNYLNWCKLKNIKPRASMLYECVSEDDFNTITSILTAADSFESESEITQYYSDCIKVFLKMNIEDSILNLTNACNLETDIVKRKKLLEKLQSLTLQLKSI